MSDFQNNCRRTKNISETLKKYAFDNGFSLDEIQYTIDKTQTYIKKISNEEYTPLNEDIEKLDIDYIINNHINFEQYFTITIKQKVKNSIELKYSIDFGDYATNPKIILYYVARRDK